MLCQVVTLYYPVYYVERIIDIILVKILYIVDNKIYISDKLPRQHRAPKKRLVG